MEAQLTIHRKIIFGFVMAFGVRISAMETLTLLRTQLDFLFMVASDVDLNAVSLASKLSTIRNRF
jgi:hypothetical protein